MSPGGDILYTLMSVFDAVPPEGSKVTGIQGWFSALPLTCSDFSRFSEPFDDIMDVDDEIPKFLAHGTLRNIVLKLFDDFLPQLSTKW